tara:strand:- start:197 stop:895 length:699 start_codon:yes stop_codon:yes gene_type:complete
MKALIGHSGFIGSILKKKYKNCHLYNSKNISKIKNKIYSEIICAGLPAAKWKANKFPKKDSANFNKLKRNINFVSCKLFILISTIDVHKKAETYGVNRMKLESFIKKKFSNYLIVRLPAVFGKGLKKNILFDLLNDNQINKINKKDFFQWFDVSLLYSEIQKIKKKKISNKIIELYSPPIQNTEILKFFPNVNLQIKNKRIVKYNFKPKEGYYKNVKFTLNRIKKFIRENDK